jgi:hypothetical protein
MCLESSPKAGWSSCAQAMQVKIKMSLWKVRVRETSLRVREMLTVKEPVSLENSRTRSPVTHARELKMQDPVPLESSRRRDGGEGCANYGHANSPRAKQISREAKCLAEEWVSKIYKRGEVLGWRLSFKDFRYFSCMFLTPNLWGCQFQGQSHT